jgi:hypothetical protein
VDFDYGDFLEISFFFHGFSLFLLLGRTSSYLDSVLCAFCCGLFFAKKEQENGNSFFSSVTTNPTPPSLLLGGMKKSIVICFSILHPFVRP